MKNLAIVLLAAAAGSSAVFSACTADDGASERDAGADTDGSPSSSSSSSGAVGEGGTACEAYAEAVCDRYARCSPLLLELGWGTLETCKTGYTILCDRMVGAPGAAPMSVSCIEPLKAACGEAVAPVVSAECAGRGSLAVGATCEFDGQCASGRCGGAGSDIPGCGLCKPASDASTGETVEGGSCTNEGRCAHGLSCIGASTGVAGEPIRGTCGKTRALGEPCDEAEDCNTGSHGDFGWTEFTVACLDGHCAKLSPPVTKGPGGGGDRAHA